MFDDVVIVSLINSYYFKISVRLSSKIEIDLSQIVFFQANRFFLPVKKNHACFFLNKKKQLTPVASTQ